LANLGALLRRARCRKRTCFAYRSTINLFGGPHRAGYFSTVSVYAPADEAISWALSRLETSICIIILYFRSFIRPKPNRSIGIFDGLFLTFHALRNVTATLALGDTEYLGKHAVAMACGKIPRYHAYITAAILVVAALLRPGTVEVIATGGPARIHHRFLRGTCTGSLYLHAGRTADSVFLFVLHQAAVHWRTSWFTWRVAAKKRPRWISDLQRFACRTNCR